MVEEMTKRETKEEAGKISMATPRTQSDDNGYGLVPLESITFNRSKLSLSKSFKDLLKQLGENLALRQSTKWILSNTHASSKSVYPQNLKKLIKNEAGLDVEVRKMKEDIIITLI